ncbi:transcription factor bHLH160 [Henckelia pumila]|uniref:transcription factor bHLH160 n=1 Tax=Henckelia pumila TaxID=405737 RepID=UPI003C6E36F1
MSSLPDLSNAYDICNINPEFLSPFDDSLIMQTYQEILRPYSSEINDQPYCEINLPGARETKSSEAVFEDRQKNLARKQEGTSGKGLKRKRISNPNSKKTKRKSKSSNGQEAATLIDAQEETSVAKKMDHNAKERIRRMKINASFLALRALLPDSRRSKKRWSAPSVVDRALKYIPELQNQIQELKSKKQSYEQHESSPKNINELPTSSNLDDEHCSISISTINRNEAIVQICMPRLINNIDEFRKDSAFANMLQKVEDEGYLISSASTLCVGETRICHHLHIQVNGNLSEDEDYVEELREKLLSWLR